MPSAQRMVEKAGFGQRVHGSPMHLRPRMREGVQLSVLSGKSYQQGIGVVFVEHSSYILLQCFINEDLGSSPGWWAATVATY